MITLTNVTKTFGTGVSALSDINLAVDKGEFVFLVGHTGSGKTTLLRLLIRDMLPTQGSIMVGEFDVVALPNGKIPHLRKKIGIIFQDLKLLHDRTVFENIALPLELLGTKEQDIKTRVEELLDQVGMLAHVEKFPVQLSGGELQRVAIARALALSPDILLADEPTADLDNSTAFEIVDLLNNINKLGTTILMATHNMDIVKKLSKRIISLEKGKIIKDEGKSIKGEAGSFDKTQDKSVKGKDKEKSEEKKSNEKLEIPEKKPEVETKKEVKEKTKENPPSHEAFPDAKAMGDKTAEKGGKK